MAQTGYADSFVNFMLGWIRGIAASIAGLFKTSGSAQSSGRSMIEWFSRNWLPLLICLVVAGLIIDWVVWLIRWRPYWLWFRKRRVVLNDRLEEEDYSENELLRHYDLEEEEESPRFHSRALPREDDEEYEYDEEEEPYGEGIDYDEEESGYEDYGEPEDYEEYDGEEDDYEEEDYDESEEPLLTRAQVAALEEEQMTALTKRESRKARNHARHRQALAAQDEPDDEWDDIPSKRSGRSLLFGRRSSEEEDDPFAVDEKAFRDLNDGFFDVVGENPHPEADEELRNHVQSNEDDLTEDEMTGEVLTRKERRAKKAGQKESRR